MDIPAGDTGRNQIREADNRNAHAVIYTDLYLVNKRHRVTALKRKLRSKDNVEILPIMHIWQYDLRCGKLTAGSMKRNIAVCFPVPNPVVPSPPMPPIN